MKKGDRGPVVGFIQLSINLYNATRGASIIAVDNAYGPITEKAVKAFQKMAGLKADGIAGPKTWRKLCWPNAWKPAQRDLNVWGLYHPDCGPLPLNPNDLYPDNEGRCSSFGGPDDSGDRMYGQAYLKSVEKPSDIPDAMPQLCQRMLFRPEVYEMDEWPTVTDWKGNPHKAGLSWALNPNSFYCAMRASKGWLGPMRGDKVPKVAINKGNKWVVCYLTDKGPSLSTARPGANDPTPRYIDLSPGAMAALGADTDDRVTVWWAGTYEEIGYYPLIKKTK